jgi:hypothetical protein
MKNMLQPGGYLRTTKQSRRLDFQHTSGVRGKLTIYTLIAR